MMEILVNVATNIVQKLVDVAINKTHYLCCFRNIANNYENEKEKLMIKQKSVEDDLKEAKDKNEEIVIDVMDWQSKATNMIKEDTKAKKSCFFGLLPNCIWYYHRGKDLERKAQEIKNLIERKFDKISRPINPPGVEYYFSEDFIQFESRNLAQTQLHEALKNDENYMVGLHGTGGSGKTKLVIQVGNEVKNLELFDKVIFVVVSNSPNVCKIQDDIASALGLLLDGNESERPKKLWSRLRSGQKILIILDDVWEKLNFEDIGIPSLNNHEGCRVLLTTRDLNVCKLMGCQNKIRLELLPEKEAWIFFQNCANISDNSSPTLKDVAQKITSECKGLPVAIKAMASTLKGRPLEDWRAALITLQSSKPMDNIHEDLKDVYKCLSVSYDNLKYENAKGLFLLCSTFPEDHEIHIEELIRYAIGIGLFGELDSYQIARSQVRFTKDILMDTCLLLKAKDERCIKMHDLIHEVARLIAKNEIHEIMEPKRTLKALQEDTVVKQKVRYLHWHNMNDFSHELDLPNLEILILVCNSEYGVSVSIPDDFFDGMKGIRVLNLKAEYSWESNILLMPRSIEVLKNLRTLDLRQCNLGDISVLGNLQRIETLELYYCSINELPNRIVELNKLRLFRLESCEIEGNPYQVIGRFSKIEELYFLKNSISNGKVDSGVVADLFDKNKISPALERYHIEVGVNNDVRAEYLNDSISRALSFEHFDASISNATIKDLMQKAQTLCLDKLEGGCKSISPDFFKAIGGDMSELIKLGLYNCSEIEYLIDTSKVLSSLGSPSNFLENLEQLTIMGCGQLQNSGLFVGNLNQRALRKLCVESCPKLTYLFTVSIAQSLVLLEDLTIKSCDAMECIIKDESKEIVVVDHDQRNSLLSMFPKLQRIEIESCGQLECFLSGGSYSHKEKITDSKISSIDSVLKESDLEPVSSFDTIQYLLNQSFLFCNIREMFLINCPQLKSIFTLSNVTTMQLEYLTIEECEGLKNIITVVRDDEANYSCILPKLRRLDVNDCKQLEHVFGECHQNHTSKLKIDIHIPALEELSLSGLSNMVSICSTGYLKSNTELMPHSEQTATQARINGDQLQDNGLFVENLNLRTVQKLEVESCPKLTYLFTVSIAQSLVLLEYLTITSCEALECIIKDKSKEIADADHHQRDSLLSVFPKLQNITISGCGQLECFLSVASNEGKTTDSIILSIDSAIINGDQLHNSGLFVENLNLMALRDLEVESCPKLTYLFTASIAQSLVLLEDLTIKSCDAMECIIKDESKEIVVVDHDQRNSLLSMFPKLQRIKIESCGQLECFLSGGSYSHKEKTTDFKISSIDSVKESDLKSISSFDTIQYLLNQSFLFCNIREMRLTNCPQLKSKSVFTLSNMTTMQLEYLSIDDCEGLKNIITVVVGDDDANYSCILPKLRSLGVYDCKELEHVFGECHQNHTSKLKIDIHVPALKYLRLEGLSNMVSICSTGYLKSNTELMPHSEQAVTQGLEASNSEWLSTFRSAQCLSRQSLMSSNIKKIYLIDCPQLELAFTMSNATTMSLEKLYIEGCDGLKHIITIGENNNEMNNRYILQKLKKVRILNCKQLECVFEEYHHEDSLSYQNHTSNLEIRIHLPALEEFTLGNLANMISICAKKYHVTCPLLKEFNYDGCPQFAKTSIIEFIERSNATQLKYNSIESESINETSEESVSGDSESEKQVAETLSTGSKFNEMTREQSMSQPNTMGQQQDGEAKTTKEVPQTTDIPQDDSTEKTMRQSIQEIPTSEKEEIATLSSIHSESRNTQSIKGSFQEDPSGGGPSESRKSMVDPFLTSLLKTTSQNIADKVKQNVQEDPISEKSKIATSSTNCAPKTLPLESLVAPTQNSSSPKLMEYEVDFHGLFKIDSRRASLLDNAFIKYPHLRDWQKSVPPRFCKCGYESLSDMLMFLKEKTAKAMDESSKEEFGKLYAELVLFGFDRDWLATIHQRVMDSQVDNEKLRYLVELESRESILLNNLRVDISRIKDNLSKHEATFDF